MHEDDIKDDNIDIETYREDNLESMSSNDKKIINRLTYMKKTKFKDLI